MHTPVTCLQAFGARSFSVWNVDNGVKLEYDSKNELELKSSQLVGLAAAGGAAHHGRVLQGAGWLGDAHSCVALQSAPAPVPKHALQAAGCAQPSGLTASNLLPLPPLPCSCQPCSTVRAPQPALMGAPTTRRVALPACSSAPVSLCTQYTARTPPLQPARASQCCPPIHGAVCRVPSLRAWLLPCFASSRSSLCGECASLSPHSSQSLSAQC